MSGHGFSEAAMRKHLETLNSTAQSIQTLAMWLLHHQKHHAKEIVTIWMKEITKEKDPIRLINLLYLANDVIQNSRRQCPEFMNIFFDVLEPAFIHVSLHADTQVVTAMRKIIVVFRDRQIYSPARMDRIIAAVTSSLFGKQLADFNASLGLEPSTSGQGVRRPLVPVIPPDQPPSSTKRNAPELTPGTPQADDSPEAKKSRPEAPSYDFNAVCRTTKELLEMLRKLEDPPSADAETRQLIASFPEAMANPALLKDIKNEEQAKELLTKVKEAEPVVKDYINRLFEEMNDRRNAHRLLVEYSEFLKAGVLRNEQMLETVTGMCVQLKKEQAEVQRHFDSLPDLNSLHPEGLTPLPSHSELFDSEKIDKN